MYVFVSRIEKCLSAASTAAASFDNFAAALKEHKVMPNAVIITVDSFSVAHPAKTAGLTKAYARCVFAYNTRL